MDQMWPDKGGGQPPCSPLHAPQGAGLLRKALFNSALFHSIICIHTHPSFRVEAMDSGGALEEGEVRGGDWAGLVRLLVGGWVDGWIGGWGWGGGVKGSQSSCEGCP